MTSTLDTVSHVIELAIAPVFLITGIGAMLGVLTNRLARIIDRARVLEPLLAAPETSGREGMQHELRELVRRARLINRALTLCVLSALLICAVIVGLFISAYLSPDLTWAIAATFAAAMIALIFGLLMFLREVYVATASLRFGQR
ncbi:MAG TPA: DUF2721 domain-containing protein [Burkholderiaceae bacterium]|nr:DUF2721 domain-containing protein [Burkholderiaceae bacterium]